MPTLLDTSNPNPQAIQKQPLEFKTSRGPLLQPITPQLIPNYDVNQASQYINNPIFNTLDQTGRGYLEMENEMSQGQSSLEQWRNGLSKAVANVPLKFLEGMGYAYGFGKWGIGSGFDVKNVDDMINNDFASFFHNTSKELDKSLPIYGSFDYNEGNILQKMSTAKFWAGDFTDGLAFLASAYGGSFIGKAIGKGAGALAGAVNIAEETANTINKVAAFGAGTIYNTVSEAGFEAKDSYESVYPELKKKMLAEVTKKYSDAFGNVMVTPEFIEQEAEQLAKQKSGETAANVFVGNLAALALSNSLEMKAFLGNPLDESKKLWRQVVKGQIKEGEIQAWKSAAKGLGVGIVSEGLWEEGMQNAMQQFQKKKALGAINGEGFTGGYFKEWLKGFSNTEGQASMILGALIGGPFQAHAHYQEAIGEEQNIIGLTKELARHKDSILASDKIFQTFIENRYKKNEDGSVMLNDKNEPVLNEEWYKNKAYQIQLDEDYQTEKINALLRGDISAATIVDQYYTSRKLWNYLANPIYENTDEAFEAFKNSLETQATEYQNQADAIKQKTQEEAGTEVALPLGDKVDEKSFDKELFKKDFDKALLEAKAMKNEFDKIQDNVKIGLTNSKEDVVQEKISKALFHEVTKRKALLKALDNPTLSEQTRTDILEMIQSSEDLTAKLFNKEERKNYIKSELKQQEEIEKKIDEYYQILNKYKEQPELEKKKSKLEELKTKSQGLLKPIISKFARKKAEEEAAQVTEEKAKPKEKAIEDKITDEDKNRLKQLHYEVTKEGYQHGHSYLKRINTAYEGDVTVGKKYQYYKELGDEEIRKDKLKDNINSLLSELNYVISNPRINPSEDYNHIRTLLLKLGETISNLTKPYNEEQGYAQTNYTKEDLKYIDEVEKQVTYLLFQFEEVIDDKIKEAKEKASVFNEILSGTNAFLENIINDLNSFNLQNDFDQDIETTNVSSEAYALFGAPLIRSSFMNNYFITEEDFQEIKELILVKNLTYEDALNFLIDKIEEKGTINTDEDYDLKNQILQLQIAVNFNDLNPEQKERLFNDILEIEDLKQLKKEFLKQQDIYLKGFEENKDMSKKHMDSNAFLQMWKKDLPEQDEFFESLFIKENPDFSFNISKIIVEQFEKNLKEKNEAELNKIEDVFYYQNRLEELKDIKRILDDKDIKSKELKSTQKEINDLINVYENHIIPLAIKNQSNRKVVQEIALGVRDKSYFNQLGVNVEISLTGQIQLKGGSTKLVDLIKKLYGLDITSMKLAEKFNFLLLEKVIKEVKSKSKEDLKPLFELIKELKKEVSEEIRTFENTKQQAVFLGNVSFGHYLENPDSVIEKLIYDMAHIEDLAMRTYNEKENWFSSPLYNYTKHLSPALLLDELKKKKFSGSVLMPYQKLVDYIDLHLEFTALHNLENNLTSNLDYTPYFKNLREQVETNAFSPTYQQEIALREAYGWWNNQSMILSYLKGVAGCLAYGTKVLMYDGSFKEVQDIKEGDQLMGVDSTPRNVLSTIIGKEQMYWVHQNKGQSYRVNESHILSTKHYKKGIVNLSIKEYLKNSKRKDYKGYKASLIDFKEKELNIDPYYLGLWLGDGNTSSIKTITTVDKEIINYLKKFNSKPRAKIQYTIDSRFNKAFKNYYNITDCSKLNNKYIPQDFLINSKENRLQLLAGLIDSDGYFSNKDQAYEITQKSEILANQIAYLTRSLGFYTKVSKKNAKCTNCKENFYPVFRVTFVPECSIPVLLERKKYLNTKSNFKNKLHTGLKIEKDIVDNYYGFLLDKDHLFILEDFTVTHNTGKTSVFLKYFLETNKIPLDSVLFSAHGEAQTKTLGQVSENAVTALISDLLSKDIKFFDKTNLIVIDEINANSDQTIKNILDKITLINKDRAENNKVKVLFLGDPTQLRTTNQPFIDFFSSYANSYSIKYAEQLKVFSPLTVAYRSDVGAINNLANAFRDTNVVIQNKDLQSSADLNDKNAKGTILASGERTDGLLNDILKRVQLVKEEGSTKAIIVSTPQEVADYNKELTAKGINNVEVLTIEEAQGRTFDETYIDIQKPILEQTKLGQANKTDKEYFFNTVMYTAVSRAKNLVIMYDNTSTFTTSVKEDVADNNKELLQEKLELKSNMIKYLDFAETLKEPEATTAPPVFTPEPIVEDTPEQQEEDDEKKEDFEEDNIDEEIIDEEEEQEEEPKEEEITEGLQILEIQNPEFNVLTEKTVMGAQTPAEAQKGNDVIFMRSSDGHIYAYVRSTNSPEYFVYLTTMYYKNLRDDVPTEKHLKDAFNASTEKRFAAYDKSSLKESAINKGQQIASGKIHFTQKLQFMYEKAANKDAIEREIEEKGGLYEYIKEKVLPLVLKKGGSTETYGEIVNYKVFIPRKDNAQKGQDPNLINSITNIEYGHPYLKFDIEKKDDSGQIRRQTFFIKLETPMLKNTDSVAAPLIKFYDNIITLEKELQDVGLGFLKLGNSSFNNLLLLFKKDFKAIEDGKVLDKVTGHPKKDKEGNDIIKYKIVAKDNSVVTKEDIYKILEDNNLSEENLLDVLGIFQKNSKELIPLLFSPKKDKVKTSANGYLDFLKEQVEEGLIEESSIAEYEKYITDINDNLDPVGKQLMDIVMNKIYLNHYNVVRSFRAAGFDLNSLNENVVATVRGIRREITEHSFVPIIDGEHKGKFFAFDPIVGQIVILDKIPARKFVSTKYTSANGIELQDYEAVRLTKKSSPAQNSFNTIGRANGKIQTGPNPEDFFNLRLSYLANKDTVNQRTTLFVPSLVKETKYDTNFDKKYYKLLNLAFDNYINKLKAEGKDFNFDLSYQDDSGNSIQFQYKEQLNKDGKSTWRNPNVVGRLRKDVHLQDENALEVMKNFLISVGATMTIEGEDHVITKDLFDALEGTHEEKPVTSNILSNVVGPDTFDETGTSKLYRKNVDRNYVNDTQDTNHGGKSFEDNVPLQNAVTTRFKGVKESRVQVALDDVKSQPTETSSESKVQNTSIEDKKAYIERRRLELESSREIETLYDLRKPITEDSKEIISKIEEANKLRKDAQAKSEQAAKETDEEKRIALNSDAGSLNEKAQILDKEVKKSRDNVIENTPIKQAITDTYSKGQRLLNKIKLAARSNEWTPSMPISKEEFAKLEDAIKRLAVKNMGEVTSNSEVIPDILLIEEINAKYDAEIAALEPTIERKTLVENGTYFLDQLENGKFSVSDNTEYPQEFTYDTYGDAVRKYEELIKKPVSQSPVYEGDFDPLLKVSEVYSDVSKEIIVRLEEYTDPSEIAVVNKAVEKMFTKSPDMTFEELAKKLSKKYGIDEETFIQEFEGYYLKNKC